MDRVSSFEKSFVEKISDMENKLRDAKNELLKRDKKISELEGQLENAVYTNMCQPQIEEISALDTRQYVFLSILELQSSIVI